MRYLIITFLLIATISCNTKKEETLVEEIKKTKKMETKKIQVIGNKFKVNFGEYSFQLHFENETQMTWKALTDKGFGDQETVNITKVEIRPNVYMIYWKEKSGTTVTHVEDFENGIVYTNITAPDHSFLNLKGTLTKIEE